MTVQEGSAATPGFVISGLLGGQGPLLAAQQLGLERTVAVKRLDPAQADDPDAVARFRAEIGLVGMLEHPGILPLYSAGEDALGHPFYAMRHIQGRAWSGCLAGQAREDALDVLERVAEALAFAHSRGVAHGGLAAEAVLLGGHGEVLLTAWDRASRDPAATTADARALDALLVRVWPGAEPPAAGDAAGFLAGLRRLRSAAAAALLLDSADAHAVRAAAGDDAGAWSQARFACAEAARLSPSPRAAEAVRRIALGAAASARRRGDLALAESVLDPQDPAQEALARSLRREIAARAQRAGAIRRLAWSLLVIAGVGALALAGSWWRSATRRDAARTAAAEAVALRQAAEADAYATGLSAADLFARHGRPDLARAQLAAAPASQRGWEWRRLSWLVGRRQPVLDQDGSTRRHPVVAAGGCIAAPHGATGMGIWSSGGTLLRAIAWPRRAAAAALAPDGGRLLLVDAQEAALVATADGAVLWRRPAPADAAGAVLLRDGRSAILGPWNARGARLTLLDADGAEAGSLALPAPWLVAEGDGDGLLLVLGGEVQRLDLSGPAPVLRPLAARPGAGLAALSGAVPGGVVLVSYGNGACGPFRLDGAGGFPWFTLLQSANAGAFSSDAASFAAYRQGGTRVAVRAIGSDRPPRWLELPEPVLAARFTGDGRSLVTACPSGIRLVALVNDDATQASEAPPPQAACTAAAGAGRRLRLADGRFGDRDVHGIITAVAADPERIYSGDDAGWLAVWDARRARLLWQEHLGDGRITAIATGDRLRVTLDGRGRELPADPP